MKDKKISLNAKGIVSILLGLGIITFSNIISNLVSFQGLTEYYALASAISVFSMFLFIFLFANGVRAMKNEDKNQISAEDKTE